MWLWRGVCFTDLWSRDPDLYLKMMLHLTVGMIIDQRAILRRLAELQYARNDQAFQRGNFPRSWRGDRYLPGRTG